MHTADLGLKSYSYGGINLVTGLNKRLEDIISTFDFIIDTAISQKINYFVIAGDINESRNPDCNLYEIFSARINRLVKNDIKVIIIAGNHDIDSAVGSSTSISYLKALEIPNVYIADKSNVVFTFEKDKLKFHCYPYLTTQSLNLGSKTEMTEYINSEMLKTKDRNYKNILVSHYSTEKTFEGLNVDEIKINMSTMHKDNFDLVLLGHIHKYEMFYDNDIMGGYSGSIYIKDFGENYSKYVNVILIDNTIEILPIKLPTREFVEFLIDLITVDHSDLYNVIFNTLTGKIKDKIVKIKIKTNDKINVKLIYNFLREQEAFYYAPIIFERSAITKNMKLNINENISDFEIVNDFLNNDKEIDIKYKNSILMLCRQIMEKNINDN